MHLELMCISVDNERGNNRSSDSSYEAFIPVAGLCLSVSVSPGLEYRHCWSLVATFRSLSSSLRMAMVPSGRI